MMKVRVYFNLHRRVFSIQDAKIRLVIGHAPEVALENVEFKVSEAGRQRVLRENRKNVHSYVVGEFVGTYGVALFSEVVKMIGAEEAGVVQELAYNPYKWRGAPRLPSLPVWA
jgi:hypothetical protein